jgi:hypothetical protein
VQAHRRNAAVRAVDGENAERTLKRKWPAKLSELPEGPKKLKNRGFCGGEFG